MGGRELHPTEETSGTTAHPRTDEMCSWFSRASKRRIRGFGCVCVWIGRGRFSRDGPWLGNEEPSDGKVDGWGGESTHTKCRF